jgi:type II secretory pathway component PulM
MDKIMTWLIAAFVLFCVVFLLITAPAAIGQIFRGIGQAASQTGHALSTSVNQTANDIRGR